MARRRSKVIHPVDGIQPTTRPAFHDQTKVDRSRRQVMQRRTVGLVSIITLIVVGFLLWRPIAVVRSIVPFWQPGTYLVLFENDAELRPTGGFIGSYAVVQVYDDRTADYRIETNIYKVDNAYTATNHITPPVPLQGITDRWALRDSNWDIDFATAAKTIGRFFHDETGETADGVIAITGQAARELLDTLGPVTLTDGTKLTSANFYDTLAYKIEKEYFFSPENRSTNEPKDILKGLVPQLAQRLLFPWNDVRVAYWFDEMLATKQIIASFVDGRQALVDARDWGDRIDTTAQQFLSLNNANLAGLKSSQHMTQAVRLTTTSKETNQERYQISVKRTHHGTGQWPDHRNDNLMRVVLPLGSTLDGATLDGQNVTAATTEDTAGRTAIGFRMDTDPGTTLELLATFSVPIDPTKQSTFIWQKQPGVANDAVTVLYHGTTILDGRFDRDVRVTLP